MGESGFTLLEVLIAATILGVGLLAIGTGEAISVGTGRTAREISLATASANEIIERMHRNRMNVAGYNNFDTGNPATRPGVAGMLQNDWDQWKTGIGQPQMVAGACGTILVGAGPIPSTQLVTVTVAWPPCGAPPRTVVLQTLF